MSIPQPPSDRPPPVDATAVIRKVNASNEAVEDLYLRTRLTSDVTRRSKQTANLAKETAKVAKIAYGTIRAEFPQRSAPLPRQRLIALGTVVLDGVACYFAAQALNGSQDTTLVWTLLFLLVLASGEVALDFYRDQHLRAWRAVLVVLVAFVAMLGFLRFSFLAAISADGLVPAVVGAALFTAVTAGFLFVGYRALRMAETPQAFRARRWARSSARTAHDAESEAKRNAHDRDRLIAAYLTQVWRHLPDLCPVEEQPAVEQTVRSHLAGEEE
jgi:hypothetical protein